MGSEYLNDDYILINLNNLGYEYNDEKQRDSYGKNERDKINKYNYDNDNAFVKNSGVSFQEYKLIETFINKNHYILTGILLFSFLFIIKFI